MQVESRDKKVFPEANNAKQRMSIMPGKLGAAMMHDGVKKKRKTNIQQLFMTEDVEKSSQNSDEKRAEV